MTRFRKSSLTGQRRQATNSRRVVKGLNRKRRRHLPNLSKSAQPASQPQVPPQPQQASYQPAPQTNPYQPAPQEPPKKRKTWLWVLGWICIFPVPLTIIMLNKKDMNKKARYGIIAAGWILYLLLGLGGGSK